MNMSAFMVEDTTINRVVTWLKREVQTSRFTLDWLAREYDVDLTSVFWTMKYGPSGPQLDNRNGTHLRNLDNANGDHLYLRFPCNGAAFEAASSDVRTQV